MQETATLHSNDRFAKLKVFHRTEFLPKLPQNIDAIGLLFALKVDGDMHPTVSVHDLATYARGLYRISVSRNKAHFLSLLMCRTGFLSHTGIDIVALHLAFQLPLRINWDSS